MRTIIQFFAIVYALLLVGCGRDWKMEVESNTDWSGDYGGITGNQWTTSTIQGTGNRTIDLPDDQRVCCVIYQQRAGYVRVTIKDDGGGPWGIFKEDSRSGETNVVNGYVELCSEGTIPQVGTATGGK